MTVKIWSRDAPTGPYREVSLAKGQFLAMRMWRDEPPTDDKPSTTSEHATVGYVISGPAKPVLADRTVALEPGVSYRVPAGAAQSDRILEAFTAIEATALPASGSADFAEPLPHGPCVAFVRLAASGSNAVGRRHLLWYVLPVSGLDEKLRVAVITVSERKHREAARRIDAASRVIEDLRAYARAKKGRFVVFGSFADQRMRHDSDLDVLLDFPVAETLAAWDFVEAVCSQAALEPDIHDASTSKAGFVARVISTGHVLE